MAARVAKLSRADLGSYNGDLLDELHREYVAKGWPTVDHRKPDFCYRPCRFGLHVCGEHPDGINALTVANFPTRDEDSALAFFEAARAELAEPEGSDSDLVVDLMTDHDCEETFSMNRQMLDRLAHLAEGFAPTLAEDADQAPAAA